MGGKFDQKLTPMSTSRHQKLHREMNKYLKSQAGDVNGITVDMSPRRGNTGGNIQSNFMEEQRFNAIKSFYDLHQIEFFDSRIDFYYNNGIIKLWRPW